MHFSHCRPSHFACVAQGSGRLTGMKKAVSLGLWTLMLAATIFGVLAGADAWLNTEIKGSDFSAIVTPQ